MPPRRPKATAEEASSGSTSSRYGLRSLKWWKIGAVLLVVFILFQILDLRSVGIPENQTSRHTICHDSGNGTVRMSSTDVALVPGELPGYTGWARPERTLAGYFQITSLPTHQQPLAGDEFVISVQCIGHPDCTGGNKARFYLRAYGPSVISGLIELESSSNSNHDTSSGVYNMKFTPIDPGSYTVEVVITFSNPPSIDKFPLPSGVTEPFYEGYLLPGFPMQVQVGDAVPNNKNKKAEKTTWCDTDQLTVSAPNEGIYKARWKPISKSNSPGHVVTSIPNGEEEVSQTGYEYGINSLGIHMDYEYSSGCSLLPHRALDKQRGNDHPFQKQCPKNLQVIFIGDSTMRVQRAMFSKMVEDLPHIKTSYLNLYGGYRRCQSFGPDVEAHLKDIQRKAPNDARAILFNSGLHDIHRLCAHEWKQDRYDYLDKESLDSGKFSCPAEYRSLLKEFADLIRSFPADLRVFQSTTSAWPRYGNFGIKWNPSGAQILPMAPEAVLDFNEIAFDVLKDYSDDIKIMDGFWVTHARPDNREIGDIGEKLSHPGLEVQSAMVRIWAMLCLQNACKK